MHVYEKCESEGVRECVERANEQLCNVAARLRG